VDLAVAIAAAINPLIQGQLDEERVRKLIDARMADVTALIDRNVRRAFRDVLTAANLPTMRIHDLRHTCATLLLAQGVRPKAVQSILGHSQISLTMDTYSTLLPSVSRQAAEQMDLVLRA
jgi:integrase